MFSQNDIDDKLELARRNINKGAKSSESSNAAWLVSYGCSQQNEAIIAMLTNLGERLKLIETALGLIAQGKQE